MQEGEEEEEVEKNNTEKDLRWTMKKKRFTWSITDDYNHTI